MPSDIKCFFLTPVEQGRRSFRRFVFSSSNKTCPNGSYHNAYAVIDDIPMESGSGGKGTIPTDEDKKDSRWPDKCEYCDYQFTNEDEWKIMLRRLFMRTDTNEVMTVIEAPVGAMWFADWFPDDIRGPDGHYLVVKTPAGDWQVDGPSWNNGKQGPGWTRKGTPPLVTVSPSIGMGHGQEGRRFRYHGHLINGVLRPCADSEL